MKITVVGSHLCPDTLYALNKLKEKDVEINFKNISANLSDLKEYLGLRENDKVYESIRKMGNIGIPCFILENGTKTLDLDYLLKEI